MSSWRNSTGTRMNRSHARSPRQDIGFVHDATSHFKEPAAPGDGVTSHEPHADHYISDFEPGSENVQETQASELHGQCSGAAPVKITVTSSILQTVGLAGDLDPTSAGPSPRVRFLSRVRISAGRRRRYSDGLNSNVSSVSGSPSSSISAPLRTHSTDANGWGSLGRRVHLLAPHGPASRGPGEYASAGKTNGNDAQSKLRRARPSVHKVPYLDDDVGVDERTRLVTSTTRHSYVENRYARDWYHDSDNERDRWWREQLVDEAFGKWPARLLNRHWWWWHLEPILCCLCVPDAEDEY